MKNQTSEDRQVLEMAILGYSIEVQKIDAKIAEIKAHLAGNAPAKITDGKPPAKRHMSAAARKRIAAGQKKRWAEYRRQKAAEAQAS